MKRCAYLDIETTSLSPYSGDLTVVGLHLDYGSKNTTIQLVGEEIGASKLIEVISEVGVLYTYNGARFDLPYIKVKLGIDLNKSYMHKDLMYDCWRRNIYGGLKEVEKKLGIKRKTANIDGFMAVQLWYDYELRGNEKALAILLQYNREDVVNLKSLREKLNI